MDWQQYPIFTRDDGSYVITRNGHPYHVPNEGGFLDLWAEVHAYVQKHPEQVEVEPGASEPNLEELQASLVSSIEQAYQQALAATLTMPQEDNAMPAVLAVEAALFAVEDPEGLTWVRQTLAQRRDELLAQVQAVSSVNELEAIAISYPV